MSEVPDNTLPKTLILRGADTFKLHFEKGHRESAGMLVGLAMRSDGHGGCRVAFAVPRKVGTAVVRNRVRRRLREAFRLSKADHPRGVDVVILVRPHKEVAYAEYARLLGQVLQRVRQRAEAGRLPVKGDVSGGKQG